MYRDRPPRRKYPHVSRIDSSFDSSAIVDLSFRLLVETRTKKLRAWTIPPSIIILPAESQILRQREVDNRHLAGSRRRDETTPDCLHTWMPRLNGRP